MIYAQFNASTLKASFVAADKKSQMICVEYSEYDCIFCTAGEVPTKLTLTVDNVTTEPDCHISPYGDSSTKITNVPDLSGTYVLEQDFTYGNYCKWRYLSTGTYGEAASYTDEACANINGTANKMTVLEILVGRISATQVGVGMWIRHATSTYYVNLVGGRYLIYGQFLDVDSGCVQVNEINVDASDYPCPYWPLFSYWSNYDLQIDEGDTT